MPLEGELVNLREVREADYALLAGLRNDLATQAWSRALPPDYTVGMYRKRYDDRPFEYRRLGAAFMIERRDTGRAVGFCTYTDSNDRLDTSIGIAVERETWGSGLADEAVELLLGFLFVELGLRAVRLWTHTGNPRAVASAEKHGFRPAIRHREAVFLHGRHHDNLLMDLLREDWFDRHPELEDGLDDPLAAR